MLVTKIVICVLALIACLVDSVMIEKHGRKARGRLIVGGITLILGIAFGVLLITTNWNFFTIPKILLFISACWFIYFKDVLDGFSYFPLVIALFSFVFAGLLYENNIEKCEVPDVSITSNTVICAKDNYSITGNISGNILYVHGSVTEKSVYKYYFQLPDGGIKQGTIPAESTTIYFIKPGEEAYIETVITTEYSLNNNNTPATRCRERTTTTYKLYIPEGSVLNEYEFDAE